MGQPITRDGARGARAEVRFFEANRSLTGHGDRAVHAVRRGGGATGRPTCWPGACSTSGATKVTVYSNVVTVEAPASAWAELEPKVDVHDRAPLRVLRRRRGLVVRSPRHGSARVEGPNSLATFGDTWCRHRSQVTSLAGRTMFGTVRMGRGADSPSFPAVTTRPGRGCRRSRRGPARSWRRRSAAAGRRAGSASCSRRAGCSGGARSRVDGSPGSGSTTVALTLAAAATAAGEWAAVVDPGGTLGARAAADCGRGARTAGGRAARAARPVGGGRRGVARRDHRGGRRSTAPPSPGRRAPSDRARPGTRKRCWSRSGRGRSKPRCASTPAVARGSGLDAGSGIARHARSAHRRRREGPIPGRAARARRDDAHVLRVVPRLAGRRGAPARRVVALRCRLSFASGSEPAMLVRARVGRSARRGRDTRHAPTRGRGPVPGCGVHRCRRVARSRGRSRVVARRDRSAHAAARARPSRVCARS